MNELTWHRFGVLVPILESIDGVIVVGTSGVASDAISVGVTIRRPHPGADISVVNRHVRLVEETEKHNVRKWTPGGDRILEEFG